MSVNIFVLTAGGRLEKYKNRIMKTAKESVKIIGKKIPLPNVDIIFYDNPEYTIQHLGIGGYALNPHLVFISLNSKFMHFEKTIKEEIMRTLAHELYHCSRRKAVGFDETLFKTLVNEGLAEHFEIEVTNKKPDKYAIALNTKQIQFMKKKIAMELSRKKYDFDEWFLGSKARKIPKWTGYTIGFNLVGEYLKKHPDKKPSQLFAVKAKELVK